MTDNNKRKYRLLYDPKHKVEVEEKILPLLGDLIISEEPFGVSDGGDWDNNQALLFYLSDVQIKKLLPKLSERGFTIATLPHPESIDSSTGWGVDFKVENAIKHLIEFDEDPIEVDVLYCNDFPVLNNLVVGNTFQLTTSNYNKAQAFFKRIKVLVQSFFTLKPFKIQIEIPRKEKKIKTAVAGLVVVQHRENSLFSRLLLEDSSVSDGMMHAFVLSPRSLMGLVAIFLRNMVGKSRYPSFGAHIKTDHLIIESVRGALEFAQDGTTLSAKKIELEVKSKQFFLIRGKHLKHSNNTQEAKEIYKVDALPRGEAVDALIERRLPLIKRASTEEFKDLFQILRNNARTKSSYLVLMVLSTVLATFGLFSNSSPVVIGAMILAPLMAPIISISMATLRQDRKLFFEALITIGAGLGLSILFAIGMTIITPIYIPNAEILARIKPNLLDLGIAVVSGVAGAYAHAREEVAKTLAGVAIAVALVPPLAVAGIGLGWLDMEIFLGAGLLLLTNLVGMVLAAALTFLLLGYTPVKLSFKGVLISLFTVLVLCVPLAFGFDRMVKEHRIKEQLNNWEIDNVVLKDINVQRLSPTQISLKIVSDHGLSDDQLDKIKKKIERKIQREVVLEISVATRR